MDPGEGKGGEGVWMITAAVNVRDKARGLDAGLEGGVAQEMSKAEQTRLRPGEHVHTHSEGLAGQGERFRFALSRERFRWAGVGVKQARASRRFGIMAVCDAGRRLAGWKLRGGPGGAGSDGRSQPLLLEIKHRLSMSSFEKPCD